MSALPVASPGDTHAPPAPPIACPAPVRIVPVLDAELSPTERRSRQIQSLTTGPSERDTRFDRITTLACTLFAVPASTVTLVDGDTALFPGVTGFDFRSYPADSSFCDHTVASGRPLVVEDATADPRFASLPPVVGAPYLRFYAGIPLIADDGVVIGSFCLYDTVPRHLDGTQLSILSQLASWAERELVDSTEMTRARDVQSALLPSDTVAPEGYELASMCQPTKSVGGDFFDHAVVAGRLVVSLVDVMGKGVGAGLVAATTRAMLRASMSHLLQLHRLAGKGTYPEPAEVFTATDRLLEADLGQTGSLVTGFAAVVDPASGVVTWVDAGHGLAMIVRADGSYERLTGVDLPIGLGIRATWTDHHATLHPGDTLLVVSDGLFDVLGSTPAAFDELCYLVRADPDPHELIARIKELTMLTTALDDVTAVVVRRHPTGSAT